MYEDNGHTYYSFLNNFPIPMPLHLFILFCLGTTPSNATPRSVDSLVLKALHGARGQT